MRRCHSNGFFLAYLWSFFNLWLWIWDESTQWQIIFIWDIDFFFNLVSDFHVWVRKFPVVFFRFKWLRIATLSFVRKHWFGVTFFDFYDSGYRFFLFIVYVDHWVTHLIIWSLELTNKPIKILLDHKSLKYFWKMVKHEKMSFRKGMRMFCIFYEWVNV